jgi:YegS/Rv2252/BmrU family lipid kinase
MILNPQSGKKKKIKTYEEFYDIFRKYDYDAEIILTKSKGDAENIIQALPDDIDLVISAGGDGTLNEIVTGNMKRLKKLVIAPLPMGSTNDVGTMYGLTNSTYNNLEKLLQGTVKKIDICYINDKPFVYVACIGDYIDMAYATPRSLKEKYGSIAYLLYGIKKFRTKVNTHHIKYKVNNQEYEGDYAYIFISNSSRIAGQPDVYYDVKLNDNMFEVALANVKNLRELSKLIVLISSVDVKTIPNVTYYRTNHFELEFPSSTEKSWCLDGEEYKTTDNKFIFDVEQSMKMLVPAESVQELFDE